MSTVKVLLFLSKTLKNGEHPIMLRVTKNRKPKYISLHQSCSVDLWDFKENLPKKKHPLYKELMVKIAKETLEANKLVLELSNNESDISLEEIKDKLKKVVVNKKTVLEYYSEVIKRLEGSNRLGYARAFKFTKKSLSDFRNGKDFQFSDITPSFILKWEETFYQRGVTVGAVSVYMRNLKTLINYAKQEEIVKQEYNPFKDISFAKFRNIKTQKRAITKEEIQRIASLEITENPQMLDARNIFMFSFYNRGINFIDIALLKWENIKSNRLEYTRRKTKENFSIGILPPVQTILEHYKDLYYENEQSYIFPILNCSYKTPQSIDNRLHKMLGIVNAELKNIALKVEIKENLTTYVARHSFATVLKRSGVSTSEISEAMGHDSEKTTQIYLDTFENNVLDKACEALL